MRTLTIIVVLMTEQLAAADSPRRSTAALKEPTPVRTPDRSHEDFRTPNGEDELRSWLQNMVWHHRYTNVEIRAATGLAEKEIAQALERFNIRRENRPRRPKDAPLLVLPYPGGRHPRIGFLEGAIRPQRDTKVSVFTPWDPASYVVLDVPEAIRCNVAGKSELIYLAHTHVETLWTRQDVELEKLEWQRLADGSLRMERRLPNDVVFGTKVVPRQNSVWMDQNSVWMEMWLTNRSPQTVRGIQVKNCLLLKGAAEFAKQTDDNKVVRKPFVACRSNRADRWVLTGWEHCEKARVKAVCPCMHSDPSFPDCPPGETQRIRGWLAFYEGTDVESAFRRIEATGWQQPQSAIRATFPDTRPRPGSPVRRQDNADKRSNGRAS